MKKDIKFSTRMASADREKIKALAAKAHMSMSDYVTACCLGKRIVVIDEQKELLRQPQRGGVGDFTSMSTCPGSTALRPTRRGWSSASVRQSISRSSVKRRGVSPSLP
ncbi:MAG: plasmid mobilization protein [Ruthenibacterium lactatiformans]|uniref:plasmid mobilization protein n=1 Tax=Ruthenibacterium lactatiformans TaxID=1550024 RepID=UPI0039951677